jgi:AbrB family looped-hinge helix DNA binding protein
MASVRLSRDHQLTLPEEVRVALGVAPGDELLLEVEGDVLTLRPAGSRSATLFGKDADIWSDVDALDYVRQERLSWRG